jgi:hypothetical protein
VRLRSAGVQPVVGGAVTVAQPPVVEQFTVAAMNTTTAVLPDIDNRWLTANTAAAMVGATCMIKSTAAAKPTAKPA